MGEETSDVMKRLEELVGIPMFLKGSRATGMHSVDSDWDVAFEVELEGSLYVWESQLEGNGQAWISKFKEINIH